MPKLSKHPRLRTKVYRGAGGKVYVYYVYDMRPEGKPDIRLGSDWNAAVQRWEDLHLKRPTNIGRIQEAIQTWRDEVLPTYENKDTRTGYTKNLLKIEGVFGNMTWDDVTLPLLRQYLKRRSAKTQGNREMSVFQIVWNHALKEGMTGRPWPALGVKNWKNEEQARDFEVTDDLFDAVYAEADAVLRDCMDVASATGLRLGDVIRLTMPVDGRLKFRASKTGKWAFFEIAESPVLQALVTRREAMEAPSVMLLTTSTGRSVTLRMLRDRYDAAREKAAAKSSETGQDDLAEAIRGMYLRDMRKRAADLAKDSAEASKLLQHSSESLTKKHYRMRATKLNPVR